MQDGEILEEVKSGQTVIENSPSSEDDYFGRESPRFNRETFDSGVVNHRKRATKSQRDKRLAALEHLSKKDY